MKKSLILIPEANTFVRSQTREHECAVLRAVEKEELDPTSCENYVKMESDKIIIMNTSNIPTPCIDGLIHSCQQYPVIVIYNN